MLKCSPIEHQFFEVSWKISNKCNYNCSYCVRVLKQDDESPDYITIAQQINALFNEYEPTNGQLYITGGEPFLWPIEEIVDFYLTSPFIKMIRITSNLSVKPERYKAVRRICESRGIKFLLKASVHEVQPFDYFIKKCVEAEVDTINIVCNDDNYAHYIIELQKAGEFDGDRTLTIGNKKLDINWMVERLTGGGVSNRVKSIPRKSRTFQISDNGCNCSAGFSTIRIEPNGDIKRCASTEVIGNIKTKLPEIESKPYHCTRKTCPGCYNIWIYDDENINFLHRFKNAQQNRGEINFE